MLRRIRMGTPNIAPGFPELQTNIFLFLLSIWTRWLSRMLSHAERSENKALAKWGDCPLIAFRLHS